MYISCQCCQRLLYRNRPFFSFGKVSKRTVHALNVAESTVRKIMKNNYVKKILIFHTPCLWCFSSIILYRWFHQWKKWSVPLIPARWGEMGFHVIPCELLWVTCIIMQSHVGGLQGSFSWTMAVVQIRLTPPGRKLFWWK